MSSPEAVQQLQPELAVAQDRSDVLYGGLGSLVIQNENAGDCASATLTVEDLIRTAERASRENAEELDSPTHLTAAEERVLFDCFREVQTGDKSAVVLLADFLENRSFKEVIIEGGLRPHWVELLADKNHITANTAVAACHQWLAYKVARDYRGLPLPLEDRITAAHLGLLDAMKQFDHESGRFTTYAKWYALAGIQRRVQETYGINRTVLEHLPTLGWVLRGCAAMSPGEQPSPNNLKQQLTANCDGQDGLPEMTLAVIDQMVEFYQEQTMQKVISLDKPVGHRHSSLSNVPITFGETIAAPDNTAVAVEQPMVRAAIMERVRNLLSPGEQIFLVELAGLAGHNELTLPEIAQEFHITTVKAEAVRDTIMEKLRQDPEIVTLARGENIRIEPTYTRLEKLLPQDEDVHIVVKGVSQEQLAMIKQLRNDGVSYMEINTLTGLPKGHIEKSVKALATHGQASYVPRRTPDQIREIRRAAVTPETELLREWMKRNPRSTKPAAFAGFRKPKTATASA